MTLAIDLPPGMETPVREAAEAEGVDGARFLRDAAAECLRQRMHPPELLTDSELLLRITQGFPEEFWNPCRVRNPADGRGPRRAR